MLLQRLKEYSQRLDLPPTLYSEGPLRYIIDLDSNGRLLSPTPIDISDPANPRTKRGQRRHLPQVVRAAGIKAFLLADKADYSLGYAGDSGKPERVAQCHRAFLELLDRCTEETKEPEVFAVQSFLYNNPLAQLKLGEDFDSSGVITFRVNGTFPIDLPRVQAFWAAVNDPAAKSAPVMQCLICGYDRPAVDRLLGKIKGVPGGQMAGTSIISANAEAFESYGLEASLIAPTCADCGERFTKAANDLLASDQTRIVMGGIAFISWTKEEVGFSLKSLLDVSSPEEVRELIASVHSGRFSPHVDDTQFYATSFSASGGRTVVRDWIDTTVKEVKVHLARWFERQEIVSPWGEEPRHFRLYALAAATVRDVNKDLAPPVPRAMLRSALTDAPLPIGIAYQVVRRVRADRNVTHAQAALLKLVLTSSGIIEREDSMVQLNPEHPSAAYQCGRLLAVLERVQRLAIPGVKAGIVDRFYGTASSAPASVFGTLMKGVQPHLSKIERDRPGAYYALQNRLEDIQSHISVFPRTLTLQEQGLFALGYYHQRAFDRAQAREAAEQRKAGKAAPEAEMFDEEEKNEEDN